MFNLGYYSNYLHDKIQCNIYKSNIQLFVKKNYNPKFLFCNLIKNSVELLQVCYIRMIPHKYRYIFWLYNNHDNKFNNNAPFALVELTSLRTTVAYSILQSYTMNAKESWTPLTFTFYITSWRYQPIVKIFILPNLGVDHSL